MYKYYKKNKREEKNLCYPFEYKRISSNLFSHNSLFIGIKKKASW